jgi:STE24 endopeptidase
MSEMTAMRTSTVSLVRRDSRVTGVLPILAAAGAAELGRRLLTPRTPVLEPKDVDVRSYFSEAELARGRRFARPQLALGLAGEALQLATLGLLAFRAPAPLRRRRPHPVAGGAVVGAAMALGLSLPALPLRAVARRRRIAVGLDTQSWRGWLADLAKASTIETGFAAAAGAGVIAGARRYPRGWWLPVAAASVGAGGLLAALAPVVLDPIFNDFTRLPEGETRSDVLALAADAGVTVGEVYSVDASRRTTAANAYVSGLGPTKRVVLFDTMLDRYTRDEVRLVVAHELGHVRHRDVPRSVAYAAVLAPAVAWAVQRLSRTLAVQQGTPGSLPVLALSAALVAAPLGPISSALSRAVERRADQFSLELGGAGAVDAFISFERGIAVQNVADLEPPKWLTRLMASHPPTLERIGAAVAFRDAAVV